jgi:glycine cleavage system T protein
MDAQPPRSYKSLLESPLSDSTDHAVAELIHLEDERQRRKVILIASESICPRPVHDAVASTFANLYAEGLPSLRMSLWETDRLDDHEHQLAYLRRYTDRRYYKGCEYVNFIETLAQRRCAEAFATRSVRSEDIFVNVQPLSGAAANNAVYMATMAPGETVMGMALDSGGHLTHGSPVNRSGRYHKVAPYTVDPATQLLSYDLINEQAQRVRPKLIIAGYSAYPRSIDWKAFREIADDVGAVLLADIAHPAGLVVAGEFPSPVGIADVITFTTHKTMCGPRGAVIMSTDAEMAKRLDFAVFPGEQGGPHINAIAGKAVCFGIAKTEAFRLMQRSVKENARVLGETLEADGIPLAYGGTDCHYVMADLNKVPTPTGETPRGEIVSRILDMCGVTLNKNTKAGDDSAVHPTAIRLGTTWMTQQGWGPEEFRRLGHIISRVLKGMHVYHYHGARKPRGRAKVDVMLFEQTKREVEQLLRDSAVLKADQVHSGYPHYFRIPGKETGEPLPLIQGRTGKAEGLIAVDATAHGIVRVTGARARLFVQGAVTADVWRLRPHQSARAYVLDRDGRVLDDVVVIRDAPTERGEDRYLLATHKGGHDRVVGHLRYLSDGYTLIDDSDLFRKVDGPVVVEDMSDPAARRMCLMALKGKGAIKAIGKLMPGKPLDIGRASEIEVGKARALVDRSTWGGSDGFEVVTKVEDAQRVWESLLGTGATAVKGEAIEPETEDILKAPAGMVEPRKPYFVGQDRVCKMLKPESDKRTWKWVDPGLEPRKTCLYEWHKEHTKTIVPFAGWLMPVWYTKISEEHEACRKTAVLFDVSHMGTLEFRGDGAERFLDLITAPFVPRLHPGESSYGYLLGPDAVPIDDIWIYRRAKDNFMVVVNASNAEKDIDWINAVASKQVVIDSRRPWVEIDCDAFEVRYLKDPRVGRDQRVDISFQGPKSLPTLLECIQDEGLARKVKALKRAAFVQGAVAGVDVIISRTGYTGEAVGFELYVHPSDALQLWESLLRAGRPHGVVPAGLGARDSTRTEAGYPLYGHELAGGFGIGPIEAGYPQFVRFHKPFFIGRTPLLEKDQRRTMRIARFRMLKRGIPVVKPGSPVANRQGQIVGFVSSCASLPDGRQVGMAYMEDRYTETGTRIGVLVPPRGKEPAPKEVAALKLGDRVPMAEEAVVLMRFRDPLKPDDADVEEGKAAKSQSDLTKGVAR